MPHPDFIAEHELAAAQQRLVTLLSVGIADQIIEQLCGPMGRA